MIIGLLVAAIAVTLKVESTIEQIKRQTNNRLAKGLVLSNSKTADSAPNGYIGKN